MKKISRIFWDTNVLLDILLEREPFFTPAARLWLLTEQEKISGMASVISLTTIDYIVRRNTDAHTSKKAIKSICKVMEIVDATGEIAQQAIKSRMSDFEDAIQYFSAVQANADCIATRNISDFPARSSTKIPVFSPEEILILLAQ